MIEFVQAPDRYREFCQNTGWYTERSEFRLWSKTTEEHCPATSGGDCCPQRPIPWLAGTKRKVGWTTQSSASQQYKGIYRGNAGTEQLIPAIA